MEQPSWNSHRGIGARGWVFQKKQITKIINNTNRVNIIIKYTVYILECAYGAYYTGVTNNIDRRLAEHQSGYNSKSYTHNRRPVKLVFTEHFKYVDKAIAFEKQVKGWRREKKEALIKGRWNLLLELAKNYGKM